jgi:ATP/maltotriose-dependent transcriptional regulator MalT
VISGRLPDQAALHGVLNKIRDLDLFLIPMDEVRGWWRYHHLFADLLRAHLGTADGEADPPAHPRRPTHNPERTGPHDRP